MTDSRIARPEPAQVARLLRKERFGSAQVLFCGGSVVRGEGTARSDLDVVVLHERVERAWRESFLFEGWPVEAFVHDLETLAWFIDFDAARGRPSLARMIDEGIPVPDGPLATNVKRWARRALEQKPAPLAEAASRDRRYALSDLLDDLRDPRPAPQQFAIVCELYRALCGYVLEAKGAWLASGKALPRALQTEEPDLAGKIHEAFQRFAHHDDPAPVIRIVESVLEQHGGPVFDGYRSDAPASARKQAPDLAHGSN